ncbi:MAG TPA: hypothetical protein VLF40_03370 [Candidatus Saccharimonadales bacterium]|nr:hypothetical protein [Candidatus Saccharimonadales bacterium]
MDIYAQIAQSIIKHQEAIIGPVAVEQAQQIPHLHLDWAKHEVSIDHNPASVIDDLVGAYKQLFGQISVEVSKEAAAPLLSKLGPSGLPQTLK